MEQGLEFMIEGINEIKKIKARIKTEKLRERET